MANTPINAMTATWSSGNQTAIKMNVTDSGPSDALSKLIDLQVGGTSKFKVTKEGYVTATNYTGSVSGSVVIKDSTTLPGPVYLLFVDGSGRRTLRMDSGGLLFDPSTDELITAGSVLAGGNFDTTNSTPYLLPSAPTLYLSSNATSIFIGQKTVSSFTRFNSRQVRATSFTGSFTGSVSASKLSVRNITAFKINATTTTSSIQGIVADFTVLSGSKMLVDDYVKARRFTGSISGSSAQFNKLTSFSITGFLTGSVSGSTGRFLHLSSSNAIFTNRVTARSFTGSISGSRAKFNNLSGSKAVFSKNVIATSFTGSFSGSKGSFGKLSSSLVVVKNNVTALGFTGSISGSIGKLCEISGCNAYFGGRVVATSFTGSIEAIDTITDIISASKATISVKLIAPNIFSNDVNTVNIDATSITSSIRGNRAFFTKLSGSNARVAGYILATSFTGSISGSIGAINKLTGSIFRAKKIVTSNITGSMSGSRGSFGILSASQLTVKNNVVATSYTGSISGSFGSISKIVSNQINTSGITGSISGSSAIFERLSLTRISASISGSRGYLTLLTGSKAVFNDIKTTKITGSISGSVTIGSLNDNNYYRMVFSTKTTGKTTLKADSGFSYNAFLNKVLINGDVQIGKNIDSIATNISIFSSSANITIGQNASDLILAPESLKIIMGANYTETAFSGSVSGSLLRFNIVSGSNGNFTRASGSLVNITDLTNLRGKFSYITSSVTSGSKAIFTKLSSSLATGSIASYGKITGSNVLIEQDLKVGDDVEVTGSFKFRTALTGSGPTGHKLFVSGAGALQGYMGIMINGTKYKIPLYAW